MVIAVWSAQLQERFGRNGHLVKTTLSDVGTRYRYDRAIRQLAVGEVFYADSLRESKFSIFFFGQKMPAKHFVKVIGKYE